MNLTDFQEMMIPLLAPVIIAGGTLVAMIGIVTAFYQLIAAFNPDERGN